MVLVPGLSIYTYLSAIAILQYEILQAFWRSCTTKANHTNRPEWVELVRERFLVFECLRKISERFTFMLADSPMDDFSEDAQTDRPMFDKPETAIDSVTFLLVDGGAIATRLESAVQVCLRRLFVRMDALCFVRAIRSRAFSDSSLTSIVIPRTVEIFGSFCFSDCRSFSPMKVRTSSACDIYEDTDLEMHDQNEEIVAHELNDRDLQPSSTVTIWNHKSEIVSSAHHCRGCTFYEILEMPICHLDHSNISIRGSIPGSLESRLPHCDSKYPKLMEEYYSGGEVQMKNWVCDRRI
jgi:hypothetical protein